MRWKKLINIPKLEKHKIETAKNQSTDFFVKRKIVEELINRTFSDMSGDEILTILCRLDKYWINKRKNQLSVREGIFYNMLVENGFIPCTVYRWFYKTIIPSDMPTRIKKDRVSNKQFQRMKKNMSKRQRVNQEFKLVEECIKIIRGL